MIFIDFETYYAKGYTLTSMTPEEYIRDKRFEVIGVCVKEDDQPTQWITGETAVIKHRLNRYNMNSKQVVAHNMAFDGAILSWIFDIHPKVLMDTMCMARPHAGQLCGTKLEDLAKHYNLGAKGTAIYKTVGMHRKDFTEQQMKDFAEYCMQDVELTAKLFKLLLPLTPLRELYLIDLTLRMYTEPKVVLDKAHLQEHLAEVQAKKNDLLNIVGGDRKVLMSNPKFAELLKAEGVDPPMKVSPTTGKETWAFAKTDAAFVDLLNHPNEKVQALVSARLGTKSTIEETRSQSFIDVADRGTLPIMLHYYGASTGRMSGGGGLNLQNLPRKGALRESICAPEGHSIVACDSSNIEARLNAYFCGQSDLVEQLREGKDIYCEFASQVYGRPITKADKDERFVGKTAILGLGYGAGWKVLQNMLKMRGNVILPDAEVQRIVQVYRQGYPQISGMWKKLTKVMSDMLLGYEGEVGENIVLKYEPDRIWLPSGRYLFYPDLQTDGEETTYQANKPEKADTRARLFGAKILENIIQAMARDIVMYQMCTVNQVLQEMGGNRDGKIRQLVLSVHDEIVAIVPDEEVNQVRMLMEATMRTSPKWCVRLPLNCESGAGKNYGEAK